MRTPAAMSPELLGIIDWAMARIVGAAAWPSPRPAAGQSRALWLQEVALARAQHDAAALHAGRLYRELVDVEEMLGARVGYRSLPVDGGVVGVRVYRPSGDGPHPCVLLFHGGAYWMGGGAAGFELNDELCRRYCVEAGAVVLNVDYRLAPEFPFPAPLEDAYASLVWAAGDDGRDLGIDPARIVVHGISSGGNLAAGVAALSVERAGPAVRGQILQMPSVDLSADAERMALPPDLLRDVLTIIELYAGDGDPSSPLVSPARRTDLTGLPPAYFVTASFDPLCADAARYAARLHAAGVPTTVAEYPMTHGVGTPADLRRMHDDLVTAFRGLTDG